MKICKTTQDWNSTIAEATERMVVKVGSKFCRPCVKLDKVFNDLERSVPGKTFVKVNTADAPDLCLKLGITSVPTFIVLSHDGQELERLVTSKKSELQSLVRA